jgi:hypothetical protein
MQGVDAAAIFGLLGSTGRRRDRTVSSRH